MPTYTAITFSPVQGFIEKSRKLRDLFGGSLILSYLSKCLIKAAKEQPSIEVISPGLINVTQGMPNRILLKGELSEEWAKTTIRTAWKEVLNECKSWIEKKLNHYPYYWDRDWENWGVHTWEVFWGTGDSIPAAIEDIETRKLSRDWVGINWIGESSSLTGTDAIAWYGLGKGTRNPKYLNHSKEKEEIDRFYSQLASILENKQPDEEPEGKVLDPHERLNIPELVKRLVTLPHTGIPKKLEMPELEKSFTDITRKAEDSAEGQWTGWFMGDGDEVGKKLKKIAQNEGDEGIKQFSKALRTWGDNFRKDFPKELGRVIYAGGDDFLGVIYSKDVTQPIVPSKAFEWLMGLKAKWQEHEELIALEKPVTLSVGFVWAASSVPQRDILQHCREAEKRAKNLGRDRVTIRVVFNSGQYLQWTCPWNDLRLVKEYSDRDGANNWSHIYNDLAQLKARHAIQVNPNKTTGDYRIAIELMNIYFNNQGDYILKNRKHLVGDISPNSLVKWIDDFVHVSWQMCA